MSVIARVACCLFALLSLIQAMELQDVLRHCALKGDALHADRIVVRELEFTDVVGIPSLKDGVIHIDQARASAYGGTISGSMRIESDGTFHFNFDLKELDLADFLLRYANVSDVMSGKISGSVNLSLPQALGTRLTGNLNLKITEGSVVEIGGFTELLLGDITGSSGQDVVETTIEVRDQRAWLTTLTAQSPSVNLRGNGSVTFDGLVDITLDPHTRPGYLKLIPGIGDIVTWGLGQVTAAVGRFHIGGHISRPVFTNSPL